MHMTPDVKKLLFRMAVLLCFFGVALVPPACKWFRKKDTIHAPFHKADAAAVEAAIDAMSTRQKVGQMVMALASGEALLERLLEDAGRGLLGGVILQDLSLEQYMAYTENLRRASPFPLLIATLETGLLNNQFCDATPFPGRATLDASASAEDRKKIRELFRLQAAAAGINWSLEPPLYRGAAWDPATQLPQSNFTIAMKPLREWNQEGMIRLGNNFSHLVYIPNDTANLAAQILAPYRRLARAGLSGFWVAPELFRADAPRNYLRTYFDEELGFDGLLAAEGDVESLALAGVDLIAYRGDPALACDTLMELVRQRKISNADLNRRVRRILSAKYWSARKRTAALNAASRDSAEIGAPASLFYNADLEFQAARFWGQSPIALRDGAGVLPLGPGRLCRADLADTAFSRFGEQAAKYAFFDAVAHLTGPIDSLALPVDTGKTLVLLWDSRHTLPHADTAFFDSLRAAAAAGPLVLVHFGDAQRLAMADTALTIVQVYERNDHTERAAADVLFGAQAAVAKLPDAAGALFVAGSGLDIPKVRLRHGASPREAGISPEKLVGIDAIAGSAIEQKVIPGCQVLVAHNGHIIYSKSFGNHDYNGGPAVTNRSIYDIASITKVAATTLALMRLKDQDKVGLENSVQKFIPEAKGKNGQITVRQLLTHTSGLQPNLPIATYVRSPLVKRRSCNAYFCNKEQKGFSIEAAKDLYFKDAARAMLINNLYKLPVSNRAGVRYSDVNMVILQQILEKAGERPLNRYMREEFYQPLGLRRLTYLPRKRFPLDEIVPTENDKTWRHQVVHGHVHDPAAALLGGVAGHAGLFSNAEDLAVVFQLLLDEGIYGGRRYIEPATVKLFTGADSKSKRGLGFDKPRKVKYPSFSDNAAPDSFGHTGFTGTCAWVDPQRKLVYIFLSNRVHPKAQNTAFFQNNIRKRIHEVVYDALDTYEPGWGVE